MREAFEIGFMCGVGERDITISIVVAGSPPYFAN